MIRRREFITLLGGAAVAWPLAARAQQGKLPTIGFFGNTAASAEALDDAFVQRLGELGWVDGRTVTIDVSLGGGAQRAPMPKPLPSSSGSRWMSSYRAERDALR